MLPKFWMYNFPFGLGQIRPRPIYQMSITFESRSALALRSNPCKLKATGWPPAAASSTWRRRRWRRWGLGTGRTWHRRRRRKPCRESWRRSWRGRGSRPCGDRHVLWHECDEAAVRRGGGGVPLEEARGGRRCGAGGGPTGDGRRRVGQWPGHSCQRWLCMKKENHFVELFVCVFLGGQ